MPDDTDQRTLIRRVLEKTGWTQTELAKRAGLDPSTLSRFLSSPRDGQVLRANTIKRIEQVIGLPLGSLTGDASVAEAPGFAETEATPYSPDGEDHNSGVAAVTAALRAIHGNIDAWVLQTRALDLAGYLVGDIVFVKLGASALDGDVVCAQCYDWPQKKAQTVFRLFQPPYLVAASANPHKHRPLEVDNANVIIKGVVQFSIRAKRQ